MPMTIPVLAALTLLPAGEAHVEAGHDLGVDRRLRGRVFAQVAPTLFRGDDWGFRVEAGLETWFRENRFDESPVRLSPEHIRYPVSGHLRFDLPESQAWGVFVAHQSNHDVDTTDELLNRETVSFELYGAEWVGSDFRLWAAMLYDRGTTLQMKRQSWPFEYAFGAVHGDARLPLWGPLDAAGRLTLAFHRNGDTEIPHVRLDAAADVGASFFGPSGALRPFLRAQRLEDYRHLADPPRYVLMLGLAIGVQTGQPVHAPRP